MQKLTLCLFLTFASVGLAAPNVLLIITDQQCADALSARMGEQYLKTPAMDSLVRRGTYFSRAYAANPLCIPSRNAMFTGRYPHETGVMDNTPMRTGLKLDATRFPTFGTLFRNAGYRTAYFGKWHLCYDENRPETHGFETMDHQQLDAATAEHAVAFLRQPHERPFLLVASFLNPHNVCELPRGQALSNGPIGEPPSLEQLPPTPANLGEPQDEPDTMALMRAAYHASPMFPVGNYTADDWRRLRWGYYRLIEKVDGEIARVLAALREHGLEKNTVVVLVSDHGEMAGAHGFNQKTVLYEESARVPLVICGPGVVAAQTRDELVNTGVDLFPTLLDLAGIAVPGRLPGRSLAVLAYGRGGAGWRDEVFVEDSMTQGGKVQGQYPAAQGRMVRTDRFKYAVYEYGERRESLVDLQTDPGEMRDLARDPAYRAVLREHRERLRAFGERTGDPLVATLLANDVGPRPFPVATEPRWQPKMGDAKREAGATPNPDFVLQNRMTRMEPFPGSRLQLNPPTFRWPAVKGAPGYQIELARDATFAAPVRDETTVAFYRPSQPLAPGAWFWRVRPKAAGPTPTERGEAPAAEAGAGVRGAGAWSGPESFSMAADLPAWPLPGWAELRRRIPTTRPRCYVRADEVGRWGGDAVLQARLAARATSVRAALSRPFALDEYVARTHLPGDTPDQVLKRTDWESKAAARDASNPAAEAAWLWRATGDEWLRDAAKARALQVAAFDPGGFTSDATSDFANAAIVENLGLCYDLLYDEFTAAERERMRTAIAARARPIFAKLRNASQDLMRPHNWQHVFLDGMVGALAIYPDEPAAREWLELGLETFVAMYPWFGGNDGGSHEGTRYYHATEMLTSLDTLDFFRAAFGLRLEEGNPWFRHNPAYLIYSFPPGSLKAELGDSNEGLGDDGDDRPTPGARAQVAAQRMAALYDDGFAAAYAAAVGDDRDDRLTVSQILRWRGRPSVAPQSLEQLPDVGVFRDIGAVFTHTNYTRPDDNVRFVFHSSPYGAFGHGHADQNSFHVIAYNEPLLLDSGYFTPAGDPHRQRWSIQTVAHNTVLVDGTGQPYGDTRGYGQIATLEDHPEWAYWVGRAGTAYRDAPLERFDRHVVWLKRAPTPTYVIMDDLVARDGTPRTFDWLLHATNQMAVDADHRRVTVTGAKGQAVVTFLRDEPLTFAQDNQFTAPAVYWRAGKNFPLPDQWHLKVTPPRAAAARFFVVVQVARRGSPVPALAAGDGGVSVGGWRVRFDEAARHARVEKQ